MELTFTLDTIDNCQKLFMVLTIEKQADEMPDLTDYTFINLSTNVTYTFQTGSGIDFDCVGGDLVYTTDTPTLIIAELTLPVSCLQQNGAESGLITFPDGLYEVEVLTRDDEDEDDTASQTIKYLSLCTVCCKVKKLAANVDVDCGCCNDECNDSIWKFIEAEGLLSALKYSGACGATSNVIKNLKNLQEFLANNNCSSC